MKHEAAFTLNIVVEMSIEAFILVTITIVIVTYFMIKTWDVPRERQINGVHLRAPFPSDVSSDDSTGSQNDEDQFSEADEVWTHEKSYHLYCDFYEGLSDEALHNLENMLE